MDKKIVVIGGGTGQGNLLRGLKQFAGDITAIVTVADDGGGSGLIRNENRMLPPGDIRNCLIALSNTDPLTERLISHRFESGSIKNQSFGNLLILAYYEMFGDFEKSINYVGKIIGAKGRVVPSTIEQTRLVANFENDNVAIGESNIASMAIAQRTKIKKLELLPSAPKATESSVQAILNADLVVIGPGSLYTSIIANLLIPDIANAIQKSSAKKVFICNIMSEHGETDEFDSWGHFQKLQQYIPDVQFDYVVVNDGEIEESAKQSYAQENQYAVYFDETQAAKFEKAGIGVICGNFVHVNEKGHVVHNSHAVAKELSEL